MLLVPTVRPGGLEPPTFWSVARHSIQLSYGRIELITDLDIYFRNIDYILSEKLQDKLYYNLYNPKDGVAQTNIE